jgi:RNA methyltransferase, TrmH family
MAAANDPVLMKLVTSRDNALFKHVKALAQSSRERRKSGLALIEGAHLVQTWVDRFGAPATLVVSESGGNHDEVAKLVTACAGAEMAMLADPLFNEVSSVETPAGILALIAPPPPHKVSPTVSACLLLEDIQDPGNLGSMLRTAAAAGVTDVLLSKTCAFAWSPKVLRAAQGAHFLINIVEGADLIEFVREFKGHVVALAPAAKKSLYALDLRQPTAFAIGNEGTGLTPEFLRGAAIHATIPMPGKFESLNAAAAAAVCLFEMARQRAA